MNPIRDNRELKSALSEDKALASVFETIVDAIVIIDESGTICHVNPAVERVLGYAAHELVGFNVSMLMPDPTRTEHDEYLRAYCETGLAKIIGIGRQVEAVHKDGNLIPLDLAVSEFYYRDRRFFTGVLRDISERVAAEEQLRNERDFSRNLINTAHAIILVLAPDGTIERFNPYLEELSGFSLDEVAGADWFETFIPEPIRPEMREVFDKMLTGRPVVNHINAILTKDRRERIITLSGRRLLNLAGDIIGILVVGNDVTEFREAERKLVQSERMAAIGQMVAGLAHESRNALQRSQASLEMLALDLENDDEKKVLIDRIQRALKELHRLYEEVRSYAAPIQLDCEEFELANLIRETWNDLYNSHQSLCLEFRIDGDLNEVPIRADRSRIQQVIRNILENAIAVSSRGSIVRARLSKSSLSGKRAVSIQFFDQGPGLNAEQLKRIFDPFFTTKTRGTGLGMAISRRIVDAHRGNLTAANHPTGGAVITLQLPALS